MHQEEAIITMLEPLQGFPALTRYRLLEPEGAYPLKFLQSVEDPAVSFACMDAVTVKLDYEVPLAEGHAEKLGLAASEQAMVLALVVVPDQDPRRMTANLAGPVIINVQQRTALQAHLDPRRFPLEYPVFLARGETAITFPAGLIGFPELRRFTLMEPEGAYPLKFLQSAERTEISFVCMDIGAIKPDFQAPLGLEDAAVLALEQESDALVLALVVIPEDPQAMTANLAGPLVINFKTLVGRQVVLNTDTYPLRYPVFGAR